MVSIRSLVLLGLFVIALQNICVIDDIAVGECTGVGECNGTQVLDKCKEGYGCCLSDTTMSFNHLDIKETEDVLAVSF